MFALNTPVEQLYLVGPARSALLKKLGIVTLNDLLFYFPRKHEDLSKIIEIKDLKADEFSNIKSKIIEIRSFRTRVRRLTLTSAQVSDGSGSISCIWFNQPFLEKTLKKGETYIFSGKSVFEKKKFTIQNPIYEQEKSEQIHTSRLVPVYSLTAKLTQKQLRSIIKTYLDKIIFEEYLPSEIVRDLSLISEDQAIKQFHFPKNYGYLKKAQERLSFDEIFQTQLRVIKSRKEREKKTSFTIEDAKIIENKIAGLPFKLTNDQMSALNDILNDLLKPYPANRLLEGDVGSGKTIVAGLAMWLVAKNKMQSAVLSPTEILAQQHYQTFYKLFNEDHLNVGLLTSSQASINGKPVSKKEFLLAAEIGQIQIIIGTHSLLEETVKFDHLALVIIDEQHRFGVEQRSSLKKNYNTHLLTMSATPIPRTLALTLYGDLDISVIRELPGGRLPIKTKLVEEDKRSEVYNFINEEIQSGRQVFVVCPLVDESDKLGVKSATKEYDRLQNEIFPQHKIGLLHGKLKPAEKERVMSEFKDATSQILVSTSVVEVGVDVPNATVMVIEGAERFGLAQLHQFRGRVGRAHHQSYCFLFTTKDRLESPRLKAMTQNNNGFELAEKDLQIRGSGELYGTTQSGYGFKIATLENLELVMQSKKLAEKVLIEDPSLNKYPKLKQKILELPLVHLE